MQDLYELRRPNRETAVVTIETAKRQLFIYAIERAQEMLDARQWSPLHHWLTWAGRVADYNPAPTVAGANLMFTLHEPGGAIVGEIRQIESLVSL